eukprot:Sspe_Gene.101544::Locus_76131_Transcript_1_1_Confidence_1.000_Length_1219::g.101544::m.101544
MQQSGALVLVHLLLLAAAGWASQCELECGGRLEEMQLGWNEGPQGCHFCLCWRGKLMCDGSLPCKRAKACPHLINLSPVPAPVPTTSSRRACEAHDCCNPSTYCECRTQPTCTRILCPRDTPLPSCEAEAPAGSLPLSPFASCALLSPSCVLLTPFLVLLCPLLALLCPLLPSCFQSESEMPLAPTQASEMECEAPICNEPSVEVL